MYKKKPDIKLNDILEQLDSMSTGAEQLGAGPAAATGAVADIDAHTNLFRISKDSTMGRVG